LHPSSGTVGPHELFDLRSVSGIVGPNACHIRRLCIFQSPPCDSGDATHLHKLTYTTRCGCRKVGDGSDIVRCICVAMPVGPSSSREARRQRLRHRRRRCNANTGTRRRPRKAVFCPLSKRGGVPAPPQRLQHCPGRYGGCGLLLRAV
jgi:hypothetical protein